MKYNKTVRLALDSAWGKRISLCAEGNKLCAEGNKLWAEGNKLCAEGNKLWAEGDKLCAEGDKLWAEAILALCGNIKLSWSYTTKNADCEVEGYGKFSGEESK